MSIVGRPPKSLTDSLSVSQSVNAVLQLTIMCQMRGLECQSRAQTDWSVLVTLTASSSVLREKSETGTFSRVCIRAAFGSLVAA